MENYENEMELIGGEEEVREVLWEDVERIVNEPDRQASIAAFRNKQMAKRQRKMLLDAISWAVLSLVFATLLCLGWMAAGIAVPVFAAFGLYSAFCFGRYFENGKCLGWY